MFVHFSPGESDTVQTDGCDIKRSSPEAEGFENTGDVGKERGICEPCATGA